MKKLFTILSILSISIQTSAQIKAVTEKGDTINVYENGIWEKLNKVKKITDIESIVKATFEVDEFDKFDTLKTIETEAWFNFGTEKSIFGGKISGRIIKIHDIIGFSITYSGDLGCMAKNESTMSVKLTNGDIVDFIQLSKTDCSSDYVEAKFFPLSKAHVINVTNINQLTDLVTDNLELLRQYDWDTIRLRGTDRVTGTEDHTDIIPNKTRKVPNPEQFFRQHLIAIDQK